MANQPTWPITVGFAITRPPEQVRKIEAFDAVGQPINVFIQRPPPGSPSSATAANW